MSKTELQQAIELIKKKEKYENVHISAGLHMAIEILTSMLPVERKGIEDAYKRGAFGQNIKADGLPGISKLASDYFAQTYLSETGEVEQSDAEIEKKGWEYAKGLRMLPLGVEYRREDLKKAHVEGYKQSIKDRSGFTEQEEWIDVNERQPDEFQEVIFIVDSTDPIYNNKRMGGRYQGKKRYGHEFGRPGVVWKGKFWLPMPELPKQIDDQK